MTVRNRNSVHLQFPGSLVARATAVTFNGLAGGKERLLLEFRPRGRLASGPATEENAHSGEPTANVSPATPSEANPATAAPTEGSSRTSVTGRGLAFLPKAGGRGIIFSATTDAYALQDGGLDTVEATIALGHKEDAGD